MGRARLCGALLAVYLLWGSTYFAIQHAIVTLPPFLMAGTRFFLAGLLLYAGARLSGVAAPARREWRPALVCGALFMLVSNGLVCWSEQFLDSSVTAILVGTVPVWMLLLDWMRPGGRRPARASTLSVLIGITGVALLVWPDGGADTRPVDLVAAGLLLVATLAWAAGSIYSRTAALPRSPWLSTGMQMLCGGALQLIAGTGLGEWSAFDPTRVTGSSLAALAWLLVAGSLIGFTSYVWLLRNATPVVASSYAFVNPLVAMFLGVVLGHEVLRERTYLAAGLVVTAVVIVVSRPTASESDAPDARASRSATDEAVAGARGSRG